MNTNYNIRNFRVFGEEGAEARIAPFTVLTGCNSSGKSSIAKSILLLDNFLQKAKTDSDKKALDLGRYTMDFTDYPLNLLGRFDSVVNSASTTGEIEYRYTTNSNLEVVLVFVTNSSDILNRGYLKSIKIFKEEITVFSSERGACSLNMIPFLKEYLDTYKKFAPYYSSSGLYGIFPDEYEKKHKVSYKSFKWAYENDSLFKVVILDKIGNLGKSDFQTKVDELLVSAYSDIPGLRIFMHRLFEEFIESECTSFLEFFKLCEKKWMSSLSYTNESIEYENIRGGSDESQLVPQDWSYVNSACMVNDELWYMIMKRLNAGDEKWIYRLQNTSIGFRWLLTTLTIAGEIVGLDIDNSFSERQLKNDYFRPNHYIIHYLWDDFKRYVNAQLQKALIPSWCGNLSYVGSSRIDVKRLYTLDAKNDFAALLNRYFNARRDFVGLATYENEKGYEPDAFMNKWLKKFGICDHVMLDLDPEGLGVSIKLHKGDRDSLLADEGYGITQLFSILLEIETAIQSVFHHFLVKGWNGQNYIYVTDMNTDKVLFPEQTIIIEEPEIHLHPKFQSLLVDMFAEALREYNIHFIIETHSEYFIRRLQLRVAEKKIPVKDVSVIYVDENRHPYNMGLTETGKFTQEFGTGFYDEADNAAIQLFDLTSE